MSPLLLLGLAQATTYDHIPTLDEVVHDASVIVRGEVIATDGCVGSRAFTFVEIETEEVMRGKVEGDSLVFRLPYGVYDDGTVSTIVDTPAFTVGQEYVVFLTTDENGVQGLLPLSWMGYSVLRPLGSDADAMVTGFGQPLLVTSTGIPARGDGRASLRELYFTDPALDLEAMEAELDQIRTTAEWQGVGIAEGPWRGRLHLEASIAKTGDASSCDASVTGDVYADTLSLTGRCNADHAGAVDVVVEGALAKGGWSGTVTVSPVASPTDSRTLSWTDSSHTDDTIDILASGQVDDSGYTVDWELGVMAGFSGHRALMKPEDVLDYVRDRSAAHFSSAGTATSLPLDKASCAATLTMAPTGGGK